MTDPGLTNRLRQKSRRAGLMVGISMAATILVLMAGFAGIYARLEPLTSDFISRDAPSAERLREPDEPEAAQPAGISQPADAGGVDSPPTPTEEGQTDDAAPTEAAAGPGIISAADGTPDDAAFDPTHQITGQSSIRLRAEPSVAGGEETIIIVLPPLTPLEATGEEQASANPGQDGDDLWLEFRTEDNDVGWVREIDTETFVPDEN